MELQKINLELTEAPQIKIIEAKLFKFQKGLTETAKVLTKQNESHQGELEAVWARVEEVGGQVDALHSMSDFILFIT